MSPRVLAVGWGALLILMGACGSPSAPAAPTSVAGTWSIPGRVDTPGPIFSMTLTQSGDSITGTGNAVTGGGYQPGAPGDFRVSGSYSRPCITLVLTFDIGLVERFSGRLVSASEMSGNAAANGCSQGSVDYVRG
jgi:hypothetical protein